MSKSPDGHTAAPEFTLDDFEDATACWDVFCIAGPCGLDVLGLHLFVHRDGASNAEREVATLWDAHVWLLSVVLTGADWWV